MTKRALKNPNPSGCQIVDTEYQLAGLAAILEQTKTVAVDLEADSMFHFREKVCLLQIATQDATFVIDPLKLDSLSLLKPFFANPGIRKIFHGADFDVRSLHRDFDIEINNLFDTELASRFLGTRETGLGSVLNARFGIRVDKKYQKKDWSQRPLPAGMIEYAAGDVNYLNVLAEILEKELIEKKRLCWVEEECELLSRVRHSDTNDTPLFMKFKGAGRLDPVSLAILEALLRFRRDVAEKKDRPPFKILSNASLMTLAVTRPNSLERLKKLKILSPRQTSIYGRTLIAIIGKALKLPREQLPRYPRKRTPKPASVVPQRMKALKSWRDSRAEELEIDPPLLFNKAHLMAIAQENPNRECELETITWMKNWQRSEFGTDIVSVLKQFR